MACDTNNVDILMAVRNGETHLPQAVDSLCQQSFRYWRLVAVDDSSTDATPAILASFARRDARIEVYRNDTQMRLPASLNHGLRLCRAPLIARADADDVYEPDRLAKQVAFMRAHPDVGILGSASVNIDATDKVIGATAHPCEDELIRFSLPFGCTFVHPSVVFRREIVERLGGYDEALWTGQDYDLWARMLPLTKMHNLSEPLLRYRVHSQSMTQSTERKQQHDKLKLPVHRRLMEAYLGHQLDDRDVGILVECVGPSRVLGIDAIERGLELCREYWARCRERESRAVSNYFERKLAVGLLAQAGFQPPGAERLARRLLAAAREFDTRCLRAPSAVRLRLRLLAPQWLTRCLRARRAVGMLHALV